MARKFLVNIDLNLNQLLNAIIQKLGSDPTPTNQAHLFYRSDQDRLKVDTGAAIKTVAYTDDAAGDAATLDGATKAELRDRTTHTGTQAASTISDFDTQVRTSRLDQMAAPTSALSANGQRITSVSTPSAGTDATNKDYVDGLSAGRDWKESVRAATTVAGTLATSFENGDAIDGVTLATGDRILIKNQSSGAENGIYVVAASGAPARAADAVQDKLTGGSTVSVEEGTANADTRWLLTNNGVPTVGTTAQVWTQDAGETSIAGAGLTKTGNTFAVGQGTGITVNGDDVAIDTSVVVRKYVANVGDNASTSITITHNLGTRDVTVGVYLAASTYDEVECDVLHATTNTITLVFAVAPTTNQYRVVVHG